jgi:hypothetical protein
MSRRQAGRAFDLLLSEEMAREVGRETAKALEPFMEEWRSTIPEGKVEMIPLSLTDRVTLLTPEEYHTMPWRSFDIYVDGPDPVYMAVNEVPVGKAPLNAGESLKVDMKKRKISKIILYCAAGKQSSARIFALK